MKIVLSKEIKKHKDNGSPILALESTIIAHGMPYPDNIVFAKKAEAFCRKNGVAPATIAVINGSAHIGLTDRELEKLCKSKKTKKTSRRDLPIASNEKWDGATTVSATSWLAFKAGIFVFATGGIGGVHRGSEKSFDVSQDLMSLSNTPIIVVSAGAKAILDLPKTLELIEALGVPVVGYNTLEFPAFYSRSSGIYIQNKTTSSNAIVSVFKESLSLGLKSSLLVVNPIPKKDEIPMREINRLVSDSLKSMNSSTVSGKEITPFLLNKIVEKSKGDSLKANISLALNNVKLGAKIAKDLCRPDNVAFFKDQNSFC